MGGGAAAKKAEQQAKRDERAQQKIEMERRSYESRVREQQRMDSRKSAGGFFGDSGSDTKAVTLAAPSPGSSRRSQFLGY
jgi:hypothetical protein